MDSDTSGDTLPDLPDPNEDSKPKPKAISTPIKPGIPVDEFGRISPISAASSPPISVSGDADSPSFITSSSSMEAGKKNFNSL